MSRKVTPSQSSRTSRRRPLSIEPLEARIVLTGFYVSIAGDNTNPGTELSPWRTLQHAADQVVAGDTVTVKPGAYAGFDMFTDGAPGQPIQFLAEPGVVINQPNSRTPDGINLEGADYIVIDGFQVVGMPRAGIRSVVNEFVEIRNNVADRNGSWGIFSGFSDDLLIENNVTSRSANQHGIYVSNSGDRPVIRNNESWGNHAAGIHMNGDASQGGDGIISEAIVEQNLLYGNGDGGGAAINADGVTDSRFANNLIYDNHASGIALFRIDGGSGSTNNVVVNNTILQASDGRWGVTISGGSVNNTLLNNIIYNDHPWRGSIAVAPNSQAGLVSNHNVLMDRLSTDNGSSRLTLAAWQSQTGQDLNSIIATPGDLFVDVANNDYRLKSGSPAIDAGTAQSAPNVDLEGDSRPQGAGYDIGSDEFLVVSSPTKIIDNGDPGYAQTSTWRSRGSAGYQGDFAYDFRGSGAAVASWTEHNLAIGEYQVAVTWPETFRTTRDAPFTIRDGNNVLATVDADQRLDPDDFIADGVGWEVLGDFQINSGTLSVTLTDDASHIVMADAVRITLLQASQVPEIDVEVDNATLVDGQSTVDFAFTPLGSPITKQFTIANLGSDTLDLGAIGQLPDGFSVASGIGDNSLEPGESTTFSLRLDADELGDFSGNVSIPNNDPDEAPFDFTIEGLVAPQTMEIAVWDSTTEILDGQSTSDLGDTVVGQPLQKTFTVRNDGLTDLTLGAIQLPAGFSLATDFATNTLAFNQTTTFTVQLDAVTAGAFSGELSFANSDADENPFDFTIEGDVADAPAITIIDNGDPGYSLVGPWQKRTTSGRDGDYDFAYRGNGSTRATWTFDVQPGTYDIAATWPTIFRVTPDAPYSIFDDAALLSVVDINQRLAPNDFVEDGSAWENLGRFTVSGSTLVVQLSNDASHLVMADAIRIERVSGASQIVAFSAGPDASGAPQANAHAPSAAAPMGSGSGDASQPAFLLGDGESSDDDWAAGVAASFAEDDEDDFWTLWR